METARPLAPRIVQLAERIAADIGRRRLKPGDSYLTTAETARLLGISTTAANRAMQLLVQRQVLERRQRKGTTVALAPAAIKTSLRRVHLLVQPQYLKREGLLGDGRLIGIQSVLPGADIQFSFMEGLNEAAQVDRLIRSALAAREPEGFVAVRASLDVQQALGASGLPVVLAGTPYPSVRGLVSLDRDHEQIGRLLADWLMERGARWVLVLMRERMLQGDHVTFDAVRDTVAAAGLPAQALSLRTLPSDAAVAAEEVRLLLEARHGPGGILCRGTPLAAAAETALQARGDRARPLPAIAVCDVFAPEGPPTLYPHARPLLDAQEWGARIGTLLLRQARGEVPQPSHEFVPVELHVPTNPSRRPT
jgi:DNA-binding LacI/PurR family transcriptional regulator